MHHAEETLLHLTSILSSQYNHLPPTEIQVYASGGSHVVSVTVTRKLPSVVYSEVRSTEALKLLGSWSDTPAQRRNQEGDTLLFVNNKRKGVLTYMLCMKREW